MDRDRDRDADGRPRMARPRDRLGRPLPYGSPGVAREPEHSSRTPAQTLAAAQRLLDLEQPFDAHEVFEDAWRSAPPDQAALWKALAQLAAGLTHRLRGKPVGAIRLLNRAADALDAYPMARPFGIDIAGLTAWARGPQDVPMPRLLE